MSNISTAPIAEKRSHSLKLHSRCLDDPYFWMRDKNDPQLMPHLEAENDYCTQQMADTTALQKKLYEQTLARIQQSDLSVPYQWQGYEYFSKSVEGKEYPLFMRRALCESGPGKDELLLDQNQLAEGHEFFDLVHFEVSPDHKLLAYACDVIGDERYQIHVIDLESAKPISVVLDNCCGNFVWCMDSQGFYYTQLDDSQRPNRLYAHPLDNQQKEDELIYEEVDEHFFVHCYRSKSDRLIFLCSASKDSSEVYFTEAGTLNKAFQLISPRRKRHEYYVDHLEQLTIRSNREHSNFALYEASENKADETNWYCLQSGSDAITLEDFELFAGYRVLSERHHGLIKLRVQPLASRESEYFVEFKDAAYSLDCIDNIDPERRKLRIHYESLISPSSVIDIDLKSGEQQLLKQEKVLAGFDTTDFCTARHSFKSKDGTSVPVSLVGLKSAFEQASPLLLYGYGAYGDSLDPWFSHARLNLLERGMIFAIAHVRGGADLGEAWYLDGKLEHKQHSFDDYIACARGLRDQGISSRIIASGGSAGGLLVGAVLNQAPELFHAAIADVPFVDVLNTLLDKDLPLSVTEYDEWGDPNIEEDFSNISAYSPYDNVRAQAYPHLLVTASLHDARVPYWEAAKWVARLREHKTTESQLLLKTELKAGHGGVSGRYQAYKEAAFEQAFILKSMDM